MQNILRGNWKLKYFIYGDDEFLVKEKINSIKRKIEPSELLDSNLSELEGKEISLDLLIANATAIPPIPPPIIPTLIIFYILDLQQLTIYFLMLFFLRK